SRANEDRLSFVDPRQANQPRARTLRLRRNREQVAALSNQCRQPVIVVMMPDFFGVVVLQRSQLDVVDREFLAQPTQLARDADGGRDAAAAASGAARVPNRVDRTVSFAHVSRFLWWSESSSSEA